MARLYVVAAPLLLLFWVFCVVDVLMAQDHRVRNLPKVGWLLLVLFFPLVGGIGWLVAGRPAKEVRRASPYERAAPEFPEYDRPGRASGVTPESDQEFLRQVRARAEEQRRREAENRRRQEQERERPETAGEDPHAAAGD